MKVNISIFYFDRNNGITIHINEMQLLTSDTW